ncbi:MAG TPA: protein-L-isoaspartate O-methyltransferase [Rhodoblastus sp.]|nr:protein-L-isoaspartate O-methyltransferase [Rhodoblastus sp.]
MQGQEAAGSAESFEVLRRTAIECQIRPFGVTDQHILASFLETPREKFVPAGFEPVAYSDLELSFPLTGGKGARAILMPLVLARLIQAAEIGPTDRVLDVAGAAGYTAAILSGLAGSVVALESDEALSKAAARNFESLGLAGVEAVCGPLAEGAAGKGPFDVIVVNGAAQHGFDKLIAQLASGGRMVALRPHAAGASRAFLFRKDGDAVSERALFEASGKLIPEFAAPPAFVF